MVQDFSQRSNDKYPKHHGFSFWRIDVDLYPAFIASEDWMDPLKSCIQMIEKLEEHRIYMKEVFPKMSEADLIRAAISSHDCGVSAVKRALIKGLSFDTYTKSGNYSKDVLAL